MADNASAEKTAFGILIEPESYLDIIKYAYTLAFKKRKKNNLDDYNPEDMEWNELRDLYANSRRYKVPSEAVIINKMWQWYYKLILICQIGTHQILEPDPIKYGYEYKRHPLTDATVCLKIRLDEE